MIPKDVLILVKQVRNYTHRTRWLANYAKKHNSQYHREDVRWYVVSVRGYAGIARQLGWTSGFPRGE